MLLEFTGNLSSVANEVGGGIRTTNFASTVGEHIYVGGVKLSTLPGAFVGYHSMNLMFIACDSMNACRMITIEEGTCMLDAVLPEVNLYYSASKKWSTEPTANYTSVPNILH